MNEEIAEFIRTFVRGEIDKLRDELVTMISEREATREAAQEKNDLQLQLTTKQTMALVGEKIHADVYADVMHEINTNIAPKVNQAMQWINYNMEDGNATVDSYRRKVEEQNSNTRLITDGSNDRRIISENVRTYFSDSSSSDEY